MCRFSFHQIDLYPTQEFKERDRRQKEEIAGLLIELEQTRYELQCARTELEAYVKKTEKEIDGK